MSISEDEYDAQLGGAIELSAEDGAKLDALSAQLLSEPCRGPVTHINIALETPQAPMRVGMNALKAKLSPFERYRHKGRLSVTDLVAPTWCEVQFEYGLQQHRSRRLDKRPESFITREGKEIQVEKKIAQRNDTVLREGHAIHTALEREIHPTQVTVHINILEEEWGLRFINMLSDIETLMLIGKCREFPVVGFTHNHLVVGLIDEIIREPLAEAQLESESNKRPPDGPVPSTPGKHKSKHANNAEVSPSERQLKISSFFPTTPKKLENTAALNVQEQNPPPCVNEGETGSPPARLRKTHALYLVDNKTRLSASLPQHSATLSSRLQLMIYKRLLDALLSTTTPFDFDRLWRHVGADPRRKFSDAFLEEASLVDVPEVRCLKDIECRWRTTVKTLGVNGWEGQENSLPVNNQLRLVYRLRASGRSERPKGRVRSRPTLPSGDNEGPETALTESLQRISCLKDRHLDTQHSAFTEQERCASEPYSRGDMSAMDERGRASEETSPYDALDPQLDWAVRESLREAANPPQATSYDKANNPSIEQTPSRPRNTSSLQSSNIIGRKKFKHDDAMLDTHLTNVLQWWHGEREPRGVAVEDSSRCHTCEYMSGCEWRERKALEVFEERKAARMKDLQ